MSVLLGPSQAGFCRGCPWKGNISRLIFHRGKHKVQERWDGAGGSASVFLGIVSPTGGGASPADSPKGFHVFGMAPGWSTSKKQTPAFNSDDLINKW